jgi:cellulose synthase/poly-beta-1,6-N-acetylglucosamine synthase-like glycosyltransferase
VALDYLVVGEDVGADCVDEMVVEERYCVLTWVVPPEKLISFYYEFRRIGLGHSFIFRSQTDRLLVRFAIHLPAPLFLLEAKLLPTSFLLDLLKLFILEGSLTCLLFLLVD